MVRSVTGAQRLRERERERPAGAGPRQEDRRGGHDEAPEPGQAEHDEGRHAGAPPCRRSFRRFVLEFTLFDCRVFAASCILHISLIERQITTCFSTD